MTGNSSSAERRVIHPELGEGMLIQTHMSGYVWEVEFASGKRFRLPAREFESDSVAAFRGTMPIRSQALPPRFALPNTDQFNARQTLETLRFGIVPMRDIEALTIGLEAERTNLSRALDRSREQDGDVLAVIGDYGFGKSHFVELAAQRALRENFVVTTASLDLAETPPGKAHEIYRALVSSLRYPQEGGHGLQPLFKKALEIPGLARDFTALSPQGAECPLVVALNALDSCASQSAFEAVFRWLRGEKPGDDLKDCLKKPPKLYTTGETARQYTYLLSGLSVLAKLCGYSGLAVLIDESELYSQVRPAQRERADQFFHAMIFAAIGANRNLIDEAQIPQHSRAHYPVVFAPDSHLFFLFALSGSEGTDQMPVATWLAPSQIVRLDDRFIERDILNFFKMLLKYHRLAYDYEPTKERYEQVLLKTPRALSRGLNEHRINLRQLIKTLVEICDLLYVYDDYMPDTLLDELANALNQ